MVVPRKKNTTTTVLLPKPIPRLKSKRSEASNMRPPEMQILFKQDVRQSVEKVRSRQPLFTHGLCRLQHFSCDSPVRFLMYSEAAAAFISLHSDNTAHLYKADSPKQTVVASLPFTGLTATKISGFVVGWGPGPVFTLLDAELRLLDTACDSLDIRVCQAAECSSEIVTAGVGNVCVWSVLLMYCKVRIQKGLQHSTFTHMALAPPRSGRPHRAFVACGQDVTVVDLEHGSVLEQKKNLSLRNITAMVFCFQLDCLIIAAQEQSIGVWGPDWEPRLSFSGHKGVVNSLFYCSELSMLLSCSVDCTICCWNVEECDAVECVHTNQKNPPLYIEGTRKGDIFFSFSQQGVDLWTMRTLYTIHSQLSGDDKAPLRQIVHTPLPPPYPARFLCVSGDRTISLVAAETGAVLTSFNAKDRVLCADYCLHKEILLALTEEGAVLQANTLTNPITLMQKWKDRGKGLWKLTDYVTENDAENLHTPGPACCMALYSYVGDTQRALYGWESLQDSRGAFNRSKVLVEDKNKFLIFLGQSGGCVSVLKIENGNVLCRIPVHNGQRVTGVQVDSENGYLLSTGEDLTVVVWSVNPFIKDCLIQQLSLHCDQPQIYLGALGAQLALTFQEPNSGSCGLKLFNLINQSQTNCHPKEAHSDHFTGLCVFPDMKVFVSSSLDRTVRIWNEENRLIRTLHLNAMPECLAHSGLSGQLFLGIRGDLYRMDCAKLLPSNNKETFPYAYVPIPDVPIPKKKETYNQRQTSSSSEYEENKLQVAADNRLTDKTLPRRDSLVISNIDLAALVQGTVKCKNRKPRSTKQTRKKAFDCYMKIVYGLPFNIKINFEGTSDMDKWTYSPELKYLCRYTIPELEEVEDLEPKPIRKEVREEKPLKTLMVVEPRPVEKFRTPIIPIIPIIEENVEEPAEILVLPVKQTKPQTRTLTPRSPQGLSPELPTFLKLFTGMDWFSDMCPDIRRISSTLSPDDFSLMLLKQLQTCSIPSRIKILHAIQKLQSTTLLRNTDELCIGLNDCVRKFARPIMLPLEKTVIAEILDVLESLKNRKNDLTMKTLLTLLAYKSFGLEEKIMDMLEGLGVDKAREWLWPTVKTWDSELQDKSDIWKSLYSKADCWLELWTSKFKEHNRHLYVRGTENQKLQDLSAVDVLIYFCSLQEEEYMKTSCVAPAGPQNTVLLPLYDCSYQPILRLGETYTMARIRRPPGIILPPLRNRPFLMHFPNFISLPLPRVTLSPFHVSSEEDWLKAWTQHYFIQQQSYVEYYR